MTSPLRLLVSDVDGTLVTSDKRLTPATIAAAAALREAGIGLALVSSRPPRGIAGLAAQLGPGIAIAGFNGGAILDADGRTLSERLVPEDAARIALAAFDRLGIDAWVFADGEWLLRNPEGDYVPLERRTVGFGPTVVEDLAPYLGRAGKLVGASRDHTLLAECEAALQRELGARARAHRSQAYYLDVTHPEADKGHALLALAGMLGVDIPEVACIGDMSNDLPMFAVAGLAIAMGNAPAAVQARAATVTLSNDADGFAAAVRDILLPRAPGRAA
ncbi:MAG: Cof-type HAD-IIB family hydrolase [Geminicoccaceae bacterium]